MKQAGLLTILIFVLLALPSKVWGQEFTINTSDTMNLILEKSEIVQKIYPFKKHLVITTQSKNQESYEFNFANLYDTNGILLNKIKSYDNREFRQIKLSYAYHILLLITYYDEFSDIIRAYSIETGEFLWKQVICGIDYELTANEKYIFTWNGYLEYNVEFQLIDLSDGKFIRNRCFRDFFIGAESLNDTEFWVAFQKFEQGAGPLNLRTIFTIYDYEKDTIVLEREMLNSEGKQIYVTPGFEGFGLFNRAPKDMLLFSCKIDDYHYDAILDKYLDIHWLKPATNNFKINRRLVKDGTCYVVAQDYQGGIFLLSNNDGEYKKVSAGDSSKIAKSISDYSVELQFNENYEIIFNNKNIKIAK